MTRIEQYVQTKFKIDAPYFLRGGFWSTLGQIVGITGGIAVSSLFAYTLTESEYGIYRYLIGIGVLLSSFSLTGLGQSVLQTAAKKYYQFYLESVRTGFIYNLGISATGIVGAGYYFYNENITLALGCLLISTLQPVINTFKNVSPFLQGSKRFKEATLLHTVNTMIITAVSITAILLTQDILILFTTYLSTHALLNTVSHLYYRPKKSISTPADISHKYLCYAKHTSVRNIISGIIFRLDTIIIFTQLGATDLAIYAIANIIPEQIKGSFKNIASLLLPKYAQHIDIKSIKKNIPKRSFQLFLVFTAITIVYILLAPFIYRLLFPKYESAIFLSQLVALSFPAMILILPFGALQSQLKERELHILNLQGSILTLVLTIVLIGIYGLIGAVIAKILSRYSYLFLSYYHLYKNKNFQCNFKVKN